MPLQRIARGDAVGYVARPERLARLVDGEGRVGAEPQLGLEVGDLVALRRPLELEGALSHEVPGGVDEASGPRDLDLDGLEIADLRSGVRAGAPRHALEEEIVG